MGVTTIETEKKLLYSGKAKSLFTTSNPGYLIVEFRDDATAFDGAKHAQLANKGLINNQISAYIMQVLADKGVPTHFERLLSPYRSLLKRLTMIPVECVMRNVAAGSLCRRLAITEGTKLSPPLYELFFKNDELHDPLISENHALTFGWATRQHLHQMRMLTEKINLILTQLFTAANLVLVDAKYEFGISGEKVYLGDEVSPDSCRIWDRETQQILDKDRFRKGMGGVTTAYAQVAERLGIQINY